MGFDKGESDYLKSKPVKGDKITEILKAFSETSEPKKTESTNLETEAQATPTPKQTLPPARTRKTLSQID